MNWQGRIIGCAVHLAVASVALCAQDGVQERLAEAHQVLVDELESYVDWCNENRMFRSRARALERILTVDLEHEDARRILGYEKTGEDWFPPEKPKRFVDRTEGLEAEAEKRYRQALLFYVDFLVLLLDDPSLSPEGVDLLQREALRMAPADPRIRAARGEVLLDGRYVLRETDTAQRSRSELRELVEALDEAVPDPESGTLTADEQAFGLAFQVVTVPGLRVLTTGDGEEAKRVLRAMESARRLFDTVFDIEGFFPTNGRVFLLKPEQKKSFLEKHPKVNLEILARLEKLDGSGIDGTADWAFWEGDEAKRLDGIVRMTLDWFFTKNLEVSVDIGWLHEGFGLYLTYALVGTRQTWFVSEGVNPRGAYAMRRRLLDPDTHWMEAAHEMQVMGEAPALQELFAKNVGQLSVSDLLESYSLCAYLFEVWPDEVPGIVALIAQGADSVAVLEERLGGPMPEIQQKYVQWLGERKSMPDVMVVRFADELLVDAWNSLDGEQKADVIEKFRRRVERLDTGQLRVVRALVAAEGSGAEARPLAPEPEFYDPEVHAPGLPIPRVPLARDDERARDLSEQVFPEPDPKDLVSSYRYSWGEGAVTRIGDPADLETLFANARNGYAPDLDLAREIALQLLDGGQQRKVSAALAHAYTDREGHVYPDMTMYDAWISGIVMEMPDVDALGIVHDVLGDYDTWVSPVPGNQHGALYGTIEDMFREARRYRDFREILASTLLVDRPISPAGFESSHINLHALWSDAGSDPSELEGRLPEEANWHPFFQKWIQRCRRDPRLWTDGWRRDIELRRDRRAVRDALISELEAAGTLRADSGG